MQPRLVVMGGGRMGAALARGLVDAGWEPGALVLVDTDARRRQELEKLIPGVGVEGPPADTARLSGTADTPRLSGRADRADTTLAADTVGAAQVADAVLAVKPADAESACRSLSAAGARRVLSIVAGIGLERLQSWLGQAAIVVRAMPNTPAQIGAGISALAGGSSVDEDAYRWAEEILGAVGAVVRVQESSLDAVTGLSGSGPAYVFLLAESLIDAGVTAGLPRAVSRKLVLHTLAGSARLAMESGEEPEALRAGVTSPGGTTAAGLRVLESRAVRSAFIEAVMAATDRSRQLGR